MSLVATIILIILGIIMILGIIRVLLNHRETFTECLMDMFFLDLIADLIQSIIEHYDD